MHEIHIDDEELGPQRIGKYEVLHKIGGGGVGTVYRGRDPETRESVAIKTLNPEVAGQEELRKRFEREIESISKLDHPNIARILEHGRTPSGEPYMAMEYVDGPTLADLIRNRSDLPYSRIARMMTDAAQGLQAAYKQRIVHGDIKPGNLMLDKADRLRIVDFGLAKPLFENVKGAGEFSLPGTPRYMAPEQVRGQSIDHRSDMYSLGCSFYHLIAGQPPFEADSPRELMRLHVQTPFVPIFVINPKAPADLIEIIHRLMAKEPAERYDDHDDLIADLREVEMARLAKERKDVAAKEAEHAEQRADSAGPAVAAGPYGLPHAGQPSAMKPAMSSMAAADVPSGSLAGQSHNRPAPQLPPRPELLMTPPPIAPSRGIPAWILCLVALLALSLALMTFVFQGQNSRDDGSARRSAAGLDLKGDPEKVEDARLKMARDFMRDVYNYCLIYETQKGAFPGAIHELVSAGIAEADETLDPWGRALALYPAERILVCFGSDGVEQSADDYHLGPSGEFRRIPDRLRYLDSTGQ